MWGIRRHLERLGRPTRSVFLGAPYQSAETYAGPLARAMRDLMLQFSREGFDVVAHSMGGLVSRNFVLKTLKNPNDHCVEKYITISTPWNGHSMAEKGVDHLSTPVPSWIDMVPGSPYIKDLFAEQLKPKVEYYLVFGYLDDSGDDGTVAITSQLVLPAQQDAVLVRGFNMGHVPILSSPDLLQFVEEVLDDKNETESPVKTSKKQKRQKRQ